VRIAIFGANGQTGRLVTRRALDAGHTAVAATRRPDEFPLSDPALTVAGADVHDTDAVLDAVADADAVVSTLGVPFTREPVNTYSRGTANIVAAMQSSGVTRLVVVSSTGAYPAPGRTGAPFALRLFEPVITKTIGKTVYDDIRLMESVVRESELDWTIVRPSGLFDLPNVTEYTAGEVDPVGAFTSRCDLADYLVGLAANHGGGHETVTISTTENTPTMWQMIRREAFKSAS
jgi:putative NADH-flavin reductase